MSAASASTADRLKFELLPLLAAQALLTDCVRVQQAIEDYERPSKASGPFQLQLKKACPTWANPLSSCDALDVLTDLARVIENRAIEIIYDARKVGGDS